MPRIGRFPPFGKRFFRRARKLVGSCHFAHFWRAVVALGGDARPPQPAKAGSRLPQPSHTAVGGVLPHEGPLGRTASCWPRRRWTRFKTQLGWKRGLPLVIVVLRRHAEARNAASIDGRRCPRSSCTPRRCMPKGTRSWAARWSTRDVVIPYAVPDCGRPRHSAQGNAAEVLVRRRADRVPQADRDGRATIIADFPLTNVTVLVRLLLFVSQWSRGACEVEEVPLRRRGQEEPQLLSRWSRPRQATTGQVWPQRIETGRTLDLRRRQELPSGRACRSASKLGRVKLVFSKRPREKSWICMATNATRWGAKRVLSHYLNRWPIEVLFKESKQYLDWATTKCYGTGASNATSASC